MSSKIRTNYLKVSTDRQRGRTKLQRCLLHSSLTRVSIRLVVVLSLITLLPLTSPLLHASNSHEFHLKGQRGHLSAELPSLNLTYYSNWNKTLVPVSSGVKIEGDHIILNATWTPADNVNKSRIQVNATAIPRVIEVTKNASSLEIDTRQLGNNATVKINCTAWLDNGTIISEIIDNVFLGNFFIPHVEVLSPNGGEVWTGTHTITWRGWDNNTEERLTYEVLISSDGGKTFQLFESEIEEESVEWNTDGFSNLSTYVIQVRATDGIYTAFDTSDSTFRAGNVDVTTTTTTTEPPSDDPNELRVAIFIAAAIILSAFFSVVVYYIAKREF